MQYLVCLHTWTIDNNLFEFVLHVEIEIETKQMKEMWNTFFVILSTGLFVYATSCLLPNEHGD